MQRRRYGVLFLILMLLLGVSLAGCGRTAANATKETVEAANDTAEKQDSVEEEQAETVTLETEEDPETTAEKNVVETAGREQTQGAVSQADKETEKEQLQEVETQMLSEMQMVSLEVENASNFATELPGFMDRNEASLEEDPELEGLLIRHYGLTEEISKQTRYYYDRIDLNGDGADEIFAILVGPKTTEAAGSMGSLILEKEGGLQVEKDFSHLYMPIVVSNNTQDDWHDLILCVGAEDGTEHYVVLTHSDGSYAIGGQLLESLDGIDGTAYLCNDLNEDQESGRYLMLGK